MRLLVFIILLGIIFFVPAQYISKLIASGESATFYNPATTGNDECLSIVLGSKQQWVGMQGAPSTNYLIVNSILKDRRMGIGVGIINDRIGLFSNNGVRFSYAYRMLVNRGVLSFGLNAGFQHLNYRLDRLSIVNEMDPLYIYSNENSWSPQFGFGILYSKCGFRGGIAMPSIIDGIAQKNTVLHLGYDKDINKVHKVGLALIYKSESNNYNSQIEIGSKYVWKDKILFGLGVRQYGEFILSFGYKPSKKILILYGYDYISGNLKGRFAGSHEILLKYKLVEQIKSSNPRNF